jgi:hypothetical protein
MAELKRLPLYPGARSVRYSEGESEAVTSGSLVLKGTAPNPSSGATSDPERSYARLLFETGDSLDSVFDFYTAELRKVGLNCDVFPPPGWNPGVVPSEPDNRQAHCGRGDHGFPRLVFTGFQGPNAAPPWFQINTPITFRRVNMGGVRDKGVTQLWIDFDFATYP